MQQEPIMIYHPFFTLSSVVAVVGQLRGYARSHPQLLKNVCGGEGRRYMGEESLI